MNETPWFSWRTGLRYGWWKDAGGLAPAVLAILFGFIPAVVCLALIIAAWWVL